MPEIIHTAMFTQGSKAIRGSLSLNHQTIPTDTGYVQMDATRIYTARLGPASNAINDVVAKSNQGNKRTIQSKNKPAAICSRVCCFTV